MCAQKYIVLNAYIRKAERFKLTIKASTFKKLKKKSKSNPIKQEKGYIKDNSCNQ